MSRHNRPASSWGKSEQEIQDISFALIALLERWASSEEARGAGCEQFRREKCLSLPSAERECGGKEERGAVEIRDQVQESCPRLR